MNRITKLLLIVFVLLIVGMACKISVKDDGLVHYVFSDQEFIGDDGCGGVVRRIYKYDGPALESAADLRKAAEVVHEEKVLFVDPQSLESISGAEISWKGIDFTFREIREMDSCYVPQIGDTRLTTFVDCYGVKSQEQELFWIDGFRGISGWKDADPLYFWVHEWKDDTKPERAFFPGGSTSDEPEFCNKD